MDEGDRPLPLIRDLGKVSDLQFASPSAAAGQLIAQSLGGSATEIADRVITATRAEHESPAACDYHIATGGIGGGPFNLITDLGGQVYLLANQGVEGTSDEHAARAQALWDYLLPELEKYGQACKARKFLGWSNASGGPIRYADE